MAWAAVPPPCPGASAEEAVEDLGYAAGELSDYCSDAEGSEHSAGSRV